MTPPLELVQRLREAIVAIADRHANVVAITHRESGNVVPWNDQGEATSPGIAYMVLNGARVGGCGEVRRITVQFTAIAERDADATALLGVLPRLFTPDAFQSLDPPLDAWVESDTPRGSGEDGREDLDIVFTVTRPILQEV